MLHMLQQTLPAFETALRQRKKARRETALTPRFELSTKRKQPKCHDQDLFGRGFCNLARAELCKSRPRKESLSILERPRGFLVC